MTGSSSPGLRRANDQDRSAHDVVLALARRIAFADILVIGIAVALSFVLEETSADRLSDQVHGSHALLGAHQRTALTAASLLLSCLGSALLMLNFRIASAVVLGLGAACYVVYLIGAGVIATSGWLAVADYLSLSIDFALLALLWVCFLLSRKPGPGGA